MKTIEERAIENACNYTESEGYRQGYIAGAEEQQEIDINKAVKWLTNELYTQETTDPRYPTDVASRSYYTTEALIEAFREAMIGGKE